MRRCLQAENRQVLKSGAGSENFNGECVNTPVNKFLQRIIHKAVLGYARLGCKQMRRYPYPKVGAEISPVGACMPCVGCAFVKNLELAG